MSLYERASNISVPAIGSVGTSYTAGTDVTLGRSAGKLEAISCRVTGGSAVAVGVQLSDKDGVIIYENVLDRTPWTENIKRIVDLGKKSLSNGAGSREPRDIVVKVRANTAGTTVKVDLKVTPKGP